MNLTKMSEEDMAWLSEQIMTLPQSILVEPEDIEGMELDGTGGHVSFSGRCAKCNARNEWRDIRLFTRNVLNCRECGRKHKLPVLQEIVDGINTSVERLLEMHGKIAFWGINDYFSDLMPRMKCAQNPGIYLVDIAKNKQGSCVGGKKIQSPDILEAKGINIVIVPVVSLVSTIEVQIREGYPKVKEVINILDLVRPSRYKGTEA